MNDRSQLPPKFSQWLAALRDGTIEEHDFAQLSELLEQNTEARRYYVEYMQLAAILGKRAVAGASSSETAPRFAFLRQVVAAGQAAMGEPTRRVVARGAEVLSRPRPLALVVASVATASLVIVLALLNVPRFAGRTAVSPGEQVVAKLTGVFETRWSAEGLRPFEGQGLVLGDRLVLQTGFAEVTFESGARVVLEGPATLAFSSNNGAVLDQGRLSALVPSGAQGFSVVTPVARFVDLGTEFGLAVGETKETEIFVFKGRVAAEALDHEGQVVRRDELVAGQALSFGQQASVTLADETKAQQWSSRFVRNLPGRHIQVIAEVRTGAGYYYPVIRRGLKEGCLAYTDRPNHRWSGIDPDPIPAFLQGAEYVAPPNNDKDWEVEVTVTLAKPAVLYVLFDDRVETPGWLSRDFVDTGANIGMNEEAQLVSRGENGGAKWTGNDRPFSIWKRIVKQPGKVFLEGTNMSGTNMYTLAAVPLKEETLPEAEDGSQNEQQ